MHGDTVRKQSTMDAFFNSSSNSSDLDYLFMNMNFSLFDSDGNFNPELLNVLSKSFFDDMRQDFYGHKEPMTILFMVLYSAAFILGLVGNIFVIAVVLRYRHMRTLTNVFLVSLTVGDLLVICICIPMTLGRYIYTDYIFGKFMCKLTPFLQGTAVAVSSLSLLSISVNRYFAIHSPLKAKILFSKNKIYILLAVVWVLSFSAFVPLVVVSDVVTSGLPGFFEVHVCMEQWTTLKSKQIYSVFIFLILFLLPLYAMVFTYTRIGFTLWRTEARSFTESSITNKAQAERILRQRRRTVKMLVAVVAIFFSCWFPYYVVMIWLDFNANNNAKTKFINDYIYPVVLWLGLSNSTVNPVCYCFMSNGFRRAFLKLCCRHGVASGKNVLLMVRFKSSDDSPVDSIETALT